MKLLRGLIAVLSLFALGLGAAQAQPISTFPASSTPPAYPQQLIGTGASTGTGARFTASQIFQGATHVRTLQSFADALGVSLGSGDCGTGDCSSVVTASNSWVLSVEHTGGGIVLPPGGMIVKSSVGPQPANDGGYICSGGGGFQAVRSSSDSTNNWYVTLGDPYSTNYHLDYCNIYGGTSTWSSSFPTAWVGNQNGVHFNNAYAGTSDATYVANSNLGQQLPHTHIVGLTIGGFGGTCMQEEGSGGSVFESIEIQGCGADGLVIKGYDNKYIGIDVGSVNGVGIVCNFSCGNNKIVAAKSWFAGTTLVSGHTAGVYVGPFAGKNTFELEIQDGACEGLVIDTSQVNTFNLVVELQQLGRTTAVCPQQPAIHTYGSSYNVFNIQAVVPQSIPADSFPTFSPIIMDSQGLQNFSYTYSTYNTFNITATGLPSNTYTWTDWYFYGPLDTTNIVRFNGMERQVRAYKGDPATGQLTWGLNDNHNLLGGIIVDGPSGQYPGNLNLVVPPGGRWQLATTIDTNVQATGTLTLTGSNFSDGDQVVVGPYTYVFKNTLTCTACNVPVGSGGTLVYQVHIGSSGAASLQNLSNAINARRPAFQDGYISGTGLTSVTRRTGLILTGDTVTGCIVQTGTGAPCASATSGIVSAGTVVTSVCNPCGGGNTQSGNPGAYTVNNSQTLGSSTNLAYLMFQHGIEGTDFSWATPPNPAVTATYTSTTVVVTANASNIGTAGNALATTTTSASASWGGSTLTGGVDGTISYPQPLAADSGRLYLSPFGATVTNAGPNSTPSSSSAACTVGDKAEDYNYIYRCVATNTWKRASLNTF